MCVIAVGLIPLAQTEEKPSVNLVVYVPSFRRPVHAEAAFPCPDVLTAQNLHQRRRRSHG